MGFNQHGFLLDFDQGGKDDSDDSGEQPNQQQQQMLDDIAKDSVTANNHKESYEIDKTTLQTIKLQGKVKSFLAKESFQINKNGTPSKSLFEYYNLYIDFT